MKKLRFVIHIMLITLGVSLACQSLRAEEAPFLYAMTFRVVGPEAPERIQNVIDAFLESRFTGNATYKKVGIKGGDLKDSAKPTVEEANALLETLKGDYLIYGTVIRFGDALTTDAFLFERKSQSIRLHFHDQGKGDGSLLDHLTCFTDQVTSVLNNKGAAPVHEGKTPAVLPRESGKPVSVDLWKSPVIDREFTGMTLWQSKKNEYPDIICSHRNSLTAYALDKGGMKEKANYDLSRQYRILGIDSADTDGNGKPEIYLSMSRDDRITLDSMILEWDGTAFTLLQSDLPWVFRSFGTPGGKDALVLAQKNKSLTSLLGGSIHIFKFGLPEPAESFAVNLPSEVSSLFSFTPEFGRADVSFAVYRYNHHLAVFDSNGDMQWESDENYGGSDRALSMTDLNDSDRTVYLYLEPRMALDDLDGDGKTELVSVKNIEVARNLFSGVRNFTKGQIVILKRNDFGFSPLYETDKVSGCIVDFALHKRADGKGRDLIYAVSKPGKTLFSDSKGMIVIQRLDIKP